MRDSGRIVEEGEGSAATIDKKSANIKGENVEGRAGGLRRKGNKGTYETKRGLID